MNLDRAKVRQAVSEFGHAFLVLITPVFLAFANGIRVGDGAGTTTVLPNLNMVKAFVVAILAGAILAALKAVWWYVSGTKV